MKGKKKDKSAIISRQRLSQERGPGPPLYPEHPSALASCPLNQSHCLALMQTLAPLWFCRGSPTCTAWGFLGLIPLSCDSGRQPGGPLSRVEIWADLLHKRCQVNPFAVPWEVSSQGQSVGAPWLNPGVWIRTDGGQDLHAYLHLLLRYLDGPSTTWKVLKKFCVLLIKCPKGFSWNLGNGAALFEIDEVHKMV